MDYHAIWSYLAATISSFADNNDTYIFLGQCVKFLFPLKTFTIDKNYYYRRVEENIYRNLFGLKFPKLEKSLTLKNLKSVKNCII